MVISRISRRAALGDWIDSRTGFRALLSSALDEPIPGGARWAYVFGSALLATLVLQAVTGVLLTFYYAPTIDHAHTTVAYMQKEVPLGWLVRGVHYYGASAVVVVLLLHLTQVFVWGAYKERREALWLAGVLLLNLVLAFGFTGYLLPWDQKAYFGTGVAGGIAGSVPLVGSTLTEVLLGGSTIGQPTLSRFFSLHVFVLPVLSALFIVLHVYLFRYVGPAGPPTDAPPPRTERFFPKQFFRDTFVAVLLVAALAMLAWQRPALLGPKADPSAPFIPRPDWYLLWTFQLLKFMPAFVGGVVLPGVLMTLLAAAPFLDRSPSRALRARAAPVSVFLAVLLLLGVATSWVLWEDSRDPLIAAQAEKERAFLEAPFVPDEIGERAVAHEAPSAPVAPEVFLQNCAVCHGDHGEGRIGPSLVGVTAKPRRSLEDLVALVENPRQYGLKEAMPAFPQLSAAERRQLAEWIATLGAR
jgi:ubiquinol-cytochrome c reductase cytochrome b subunit